MHEDPLFCITMGLGNALLSADWDGLVLLLRSGGRLGLPSVLHAAAV
jgi:hypothetical protein